MNDILNNIKSCFNWYVSWCSVVLSLLKSALAIFMCLLLPQLHLCFLCVTVWRDVQDIYRSLVLFLVLLNCLTTFKYVLLMTHWSKYGWKICTIFCLMRISYIFFYLWAKCHLPSQMLILPCKIPNCYVHVISLPALIFAHHPADASV